MDEAWDRMASDYVESGRQNWESDEFTWGIFSVPEAEIGMLPPDLVGMDTIELGCGTAYISAWLARHGARPVGIDNSPAQLTTTRQFQVEFGLAFPLHRGDAERTSFPDESFDFAFTWSDGSVEFHLPHGEMFRLLRDSGFEVEDLVEVRIPDDATTRYPYVAPDGARRWPAEEVWEARKP